MLKIRLLAVILLKDYHNHISLARRIHELMVIFSFRSYTFVKSWTESKENPKIDEPQRMKTER
jgi:hypothetical protein